MLFTDNEALLLLTLARNTLEHELLGEVSIDPSELPDKFKKATATFVTLKKEGQLRGCIGSLKPVRPLLDDIQYNARAAAFNDYRFSPVTADELSLITIELSLLGDISPLLVSDEDDLRQKLEPYRDGLVLEYGAHRATFLPAVWEQLPQPRQFLSQLKLKAGLSPDFWHDDMKLFTYQVEKIVESGYSIDK